MSIPPSIYYTFTRYVVLHLIFSNLFNMYKIVLSNEVAEIALMHLFFFFFYKRSMFHTFHTFIFMFSFFFFY